MARHRVHSRTEVDAILRDHSARRLSPEQSAHELGVGMSTFRDYLEEAGGKIATVRFIVMPTTDVRGDTDGKTERSRARTAARAR